MTIEFQDLDIFPSSSLDGSDFLLFGQGGNQVPANPTRTDFQLTLDNLFAYLIDRINRENTFEVGDIHITQNSANPTLKYGGTWALLQKETVLIAGSSSEVGAGSMTPQGNNAPVVPIPLHNHTASFSGNQLPNHAHGVAATLADAKFLYAGGGGNAGVVTPSKTTRATHGATAGTPSGSVTVNNNGTDGATLDVRGQRVYVYIWKKTA